MGQVSVETKQGSTVDRIPAWIHRVIQEPKNPCYDGNNLLLLEAVQLRRFDAGIDIGVAVSLHWIDNPSPPFPCSCAVIISLTVCVWVFECGLSLYACAHCV